MTDSKPPILTSKSLAIITKVIAIFAAFYLVTVAVKLYSDPSSANPLLPVEFDYPIYFMAAIHAIVLLAAGACVLLKKYNWPVAILGIIVIAGSRIYYAEIANWVWSWSA